jgi:hypothetical protein
MRDGVRQKRVGPFERGRAATGDDRTNATSAATDARAFPNRLGLSLEKWWGRPGLSTGSTLTHLCLPGHDISRATDWVRSLAVCNVCPSTPLTLRCRSTSTKAVPTISSTHIALGRLQMELPSRRAWSSPTIARQIGSTRGRCPIPSPFAAPTRERALSVGVRPNAWLRPLRSRRRG